MITNSRKKDGNAVRTCGNHSDRNAFDLISSFSARKYSIPLYIAFAFFCLFVSAKIGGYNVFDITGDKNEAATILYLLDYRVGFTTRLLIGAVLGLFTDRITPTLIFQISGYSVLVSFLLHAFLGGMVLRKSVAKREYLITIFTLIFLLHSLTSLQNIRIKGCLDTYIYILFLLWLFLFDRYISVYTAPVLCVVCMLIHYSYIFTFMPPVLALMVYGMFMSEKRNKRICCGTSFGLGAAVVLVLFIYFVFFANDHLKMTRDELYNYMESKYELMPMEEIHLRKIFDGDLFFRGYLDLYLYYENCISGMFVGEDKGLGFIRSEVVRFVSTSVYIKYAIVFLPFFVSISFLWFACMKKVTGAKKIPYVVFICMPVALFPACYMSTDVWRWVSASLIAQLSVLFALYKVEDKALLEVIGNKKLQKKNVKITLVALCSIYIAYALWFGVDLPISV